MDIAVIGAGPTGLYAAGLLRQLYPESRVDIFERRHSSQISGFGYTVHDKSLGLLAILDRGIAASLAQQGTSPFTRRSLAFRDKQVELDPEVCRRMPIIGIQYDCLIKVLKEYVTSRQVNILHDYPITDLEDLAQNHDLVILANGANSAFLQYFDPLRIDTGLSYAWGKKEEYSDAMTMSMDIIDDIPFIRHQYPISKSSTALIVEVREQHAAAIAGSLANDSRIGQYFTEGIDFRKIPLCLCRKRVHENLVCIGDAALAQYFAAGAGLYFGLMQTGLLFHHLDVTPGTIRQKLTAYDAQVTDYFRHQWEPNNTLIRRKQALLAEYVLMTDEAILAAMVADDQA